MTTTTNDGTTTDDQGQDQDGPDQQHQTDPPVDLFERGADLLEQADFAPEIVQRVRDSYDYGETFSDRRLRVIAEADPEIASKIRTEIENEAASKAADAAREKEQERLDALQAEEHDEEMARLQDEAATVAHEAEMEQFFADGGLDKAWALADAVSGKETSFAEALTAWDQVDALTREVASSRFGVGVIDFDPNPPNPEEAS